MNNQPISDAEHEKDSSNSNVFDEVIIEDGFTGSPESADKKAL